MAENEEIIEEESTGEDSSEKKNPSKGLFSKKQLLAGGIILFVVLLVLILVLLKISFFSQSEPVQTSIQTQGISQSEQKKLAKEAQKKEKERQKAEAKAKADAEKLKKEQEKKAKEEQKRKEKELKNIKYIKVYENLDASQVANVLRELSIAGIRFNTIQKGKYFTVEIEQSRVETAKDMLAIKGLPNGAIKGFELFDSSQGLGVTEFDKRIRFVRAISGELEKAIMQFDAIQSCKVQIVLPEQKLFATSTPLVTASILIRKAPGHTLTDDIVLAIIQLVSNGVENLKPENVSIIDTEGSVLSNGIFDRVNKKGMSNVPRHTIQQVPTPITLNEETLSEEISTPTVLSEETVSSSITEETKINPPTVSVSIATTQVSENISQTKGKPLAPDLSYLSDWFGFKENYEQLLIKKASSQLEYMLPKYMFKLTINADIGQIDQDGLPDIKRISSNLLIDGTKIDVYVDKALKDNILQIIQGTTGYVDGRDSINIEVTDFPIMSAKEIMALEKKVDQLTEKELKPIKREPMKKLPLFGYQFLRIYQHYRYHFDYLLYLGLILVISLAVIILFVKKLKKLKQEKQAQPQPEKEEELDVNEFKFQDDSAQKEGKSPSLEISSEPTPDQGAPSETPQPQEETPTTVVQEPEEEPIPEEPEIVEPPPPQIDIPKIAAILSQQRPQIVAFMLSKFEEPIKTEIIAQLPGSLIDQTKKVTVEHTSASERIYQRLFEELLQS